MRNEFLSDQNIKSYLQAERACPWASKIVRVDGGWRCFESITDYQIWRNQA